MVVLSAITTAKIKEETVESNLLCHLFRPWQEHLDCQISSLIRYGLTIERDFSTVQLNQVPTGLNRVALLKMAASSQKAQRPFF